jgi:hypothetical protein
MSSLPVPLKAAGEATPAAPLEAEVMADAPEGDAEVIAGAEEVVDEEDWPAQPPAEAHGEVVAEEQRPSLDVESHDIPESAAQSPAWAPETERPPSPEADTSTIDLSIDSLPHLQLVEPIPVKVTHMGDTLYTATVDAIRLSGTSTTMGGALVTVKEEIESLFGRLTKSTRLHADEESDLQYLLAHIRSLSHIRSSEPPREHKRGLWR